MEIMNPLPAAKLEAAVEALGLSNRSIAIDLGCDNRCVSYTAEAATENKERAQLVIAEREKWAQFEHFDESRPPGEPASFPHRGYSHRDLQWVEAFAPVPGKPLIRALS